MMNGKGEIGNKPKQVINYSKNRMLKELLWNLDFQDIDFHVSHKFLGADIFLVDTGSRNLISWDKISPCLTMIPHEIESCKIIEVETVGVVCTRKGYMPKDMYTFLSSSKSVVHFLDIVCCLDDGEYCESVIYAQWDNYGLQYVLEII